MGEGRRGAVGKTVDSAKFLRPVFKTTSRLRV